MAFQALRFVGVFYLTWAFATVNRLLQLIVGHSYFWLMFLHTVFVPMQGVSVLFLFCVLIVYHIADGRPHLAYFAASQGSRQMISC